MAAAALIKFKQGATVGNPGQAFKGVTGTSVVLENSDNTGVASWQIDLLYADERSTLVAADAVVFSNNGATPSYTFTPDGRGSYRLQLKVWSVPNRAGVPDDIDIRVFAAPEVHGMVVPPAQLWPVPLPAPESGQVGAKPNELNFGGQAFGWAGDGNNDGLMNDLVRRVDGFADITGGGGGGPTTTPALADVLAEGNATGSHDIILSNGDAVTGAPGTVGSGQDGNDAWLHGGNAAGNGNGGDVIIEGGAGSGSGDRGLVRVRDMVDPTDPRDGVNLQTLTTAVASAGAVTSVFTRTGAVTAQSGDYTSTQITNSSGVSGSSVTAALNALASLISGLVTGVSSVFGRTGAVLATLGDYVASKITNDSSVAGATTKDALNTLKTAVDGLTSGTAIFDIMSPTRSSGTSASSKQDQITITTSSTYTLLNYTGGSPGYVSYLLIAAAKGTFSADTRLKVYIDGSGTASIDVPLRLLLACVYVGDLTHTWGIRYINHNGDGTNLSCAFRVPIPFATGIKIDVVTPSSGVSGSMWTTVQYHTGITNNWPYTRKLHVDWVSASSIAAYTETDIVPLTSAKGRLVGVFMMSDDFPGNQTPRLAALEGPIKIYLDGSLAHESSGTEDYFGAGFYGGGGTAPWTAGTDAGVLYRDANAASFIRMHHEDPIRFATSIRVTRTNGQASNIAITGGTNTLYAAAIWYSES